MTTQLRFQAPSVELSKLKSLWLNLTESVCNLKCKHCYLSCTQNAKPQNFLFLDKIKKSLAEAKNFEIEEICLNGGEPFLHPDINAIIRLALKYANVIILTNGTLINDKKARFLKQIENDHNYELIFRISLDHYTEQKNDEIRGKGSFKKITTGIENLIRHGFNPIISAVNIWDEDFDSLKAGFFQLLSKYNIEPDEINLKIIPPLKIGEYAKNFQPYDENEFVSQDKMNGVDVTRFDCANSRVLSNNGIYACPALINDPRGKVGNDLSDFSKKCFLEQNACFTCVKDNKGIFNNIWIN